MDTPSRTVRPAAVAGKFYPANPEQLRGLIQEFLDAANRLPVAGNPKAVIAPHAGYIFSGPIAASAFRPWQTASDSIRQIILLGPAHYVPFAGLAASTASAFATPLGHAPIDREAIESILDLPQVQEFDLAHAAEHSLEVEIPFLQVILKDFTLVPLLVGDATQEEVVEVLERLWNGSSTRIVVSSDLSHYLDYESAKVMDESTAKHIEALEPEFLTPHCACGCLPIAGLLRAANRRKLQAQSIDLRNSADTAGSRRQVVGYGAFLFGETMTKVPDRIQEVAAKPGENSPARRPCPVVPESDHLK